MSVKEFLASSRIRWIIGTLLIAVTALNYFDRQALPVAILALQHDIPISNQQYGQIQFAFLLAYALMYVAGGWLIDRLGTRLGYAVFVLWWTISSAMQSAVSSVYGLAAYRFSLGLGEGGGFPGCARTISEWFPAAERAFAFGMINTGSSIGAVLAPPVISYIIYLLGWRWVFLFSGLLGLLWLAAWLILYRSQRLEARLAQSESSIGLERAAAVLEPRIAWRELLRLRQTWGLMLARFLCDSAWYFYIFWLPKYLGDVRHLTTTQLGLFAWIPYAFAGVGALLGGWLSSRLLRQSGSINWARKLPLAIGALVMPCSLLISSATIGWVLVWFSVAFLGHQMFSTLTQTIVIDLFPSSSAASATGIVGGAGIAGAMLFNLFAGEVVSRYHSYSLLFTLSAILHPLALVSVLVLTRSFQRIAARGNVVLAPVN